MEMMNVILPVVLGLMVVTNIITEVIKKLTWDKIPTNLMVMIIAEALTLGCGAAYAQINNIVLVWYHIAGACVVGVFVAYAAMFGFDKFRQMVEQMAKE